MPDFLHSPADLLLGLLSAGLLALSVCFWLVWSKMQRLARREERTLRQTEKYLHEQIASLSEKVNGELARQRREAEQAQHTLETSVRRRLDELQALIEGLRLLEAKLHTRFSPPPAEQTPDSAAREARGGLSVIARSAKAGGQENPR